MNKGKKLYEGKAKILYEGPEKGTAIQHMLLSKDFCRWCFSRIYLISGSVTEGGELIDKSWEALAEYNEKELKIDPNRERTLFPADPKILQQLVNNFEKIAQVWKDKIARGVMKTPLITQFDRLPLC